MDPGILGILVPFFIFGGVFTLIGMKMHYRHLEDKHLSGGGPQEVEQLAEAVDNLSAEVELLRTEHLELNERMDFTERLLERPKTEE